MEAITDKLACALGMPEQNVNEQPTSPLNRPWVAEEIEDALGKVPILRIKNMGLACLKHSIYMKLESCNPGGSIKEKNAAYLIKRAEQEGLLKPGGTIVESSSGNFGIGLAMIGAAKGYRVIIVIDAKTPRTTQQILNAYGARLVNVPLSLADENGSMQVARMARAKSLADDIDGAWYPCQHKNPWNPLAHAEYTAPEVVQNFGVPDVIVVGISTAGQISGLCQFFRRYYPKVKVIVVDVAGSAILGTPRHAYKMTGLGLSFIPPNFDLAHFDAAYSVSDTLAFSVCRQLARQEGLLLGASTGAILAAAMAYGLNHNNRLRMLLINPDRGDRYLETLYNDQWLVEQGLSLSSGDELETDIMALQEVPPAMVAENYLK